jgi:hypothetical protein
LGPKCAKKHIWNNKGDDELIWLVVYLPLLKNKSSSMGLGWHPYFYYGRIKNCSRPPTSHFFGGDWSNSMTGIEVELMKCLVMLHDFTYFWNNNHGYFTQWLVGVNPMFTSYFEHILLMTIWS